MRRALCEHALPSSLYSFTRVAELNKDGSGLGDQIFIDKMDRQMREVLEASAHIFGDGDALAARVEQRQQDEVAAMMSDLDASLKHALVKLEPKRATKDAWTMAEDIQLLQQVSTELSLRLD